MILFEQFDNHSATWTRSSHRHAASSTLWMLTTPIRTHIFLQPAIILLSLAVTHPDSPTHSPCSPPLIHPASELHLVSFLLASFFKRKSCLLCCSLPCFFTPLFRLVLSSRLIVRALSYKAPIFHIRSLLHVSPLPVILISTFLIILFSLSFAHF